MFDLSKEGRQALLPAEIYWRIIEGDRKTSANGKKREVPLLFSGVTGCTKTSSVDNCYSSSFISVFEAEHEDL